MAHSNPNFYDSIVAGISSSQDHWATGSLTGSYVSYIAEIIYGAITPSTTSNPDGDSRLLQSIVAGIFSTSHIIPSELADYSNIAVAINNLFQEVRVTLEQISGGAATALQTTSTTVNVANSPPPEVGQVLTATSDSEATWQNAATGTTLVTLAVDIDLTVTGNSVIDTRPESPTGLGRWKLMSIDLRLKDGLESGSSIISIGSTSSGQEIILNQTILPATTVGSIVGGFALNTLGSNMSQVTGFEVIYPFLQQIWANVTVSGSPSTGTVTAYLLWQGLP
jgi:hypothetical protein